ncbi:putative KH and PIN-domain containing protein [Candidatus Burarchaeum australiense]|nr:putative KH and PIN-domain containing protein [Candidatus Burarchaeum australiense]
MQTLEKLVGKFSFAQTRQEQEAIVVQALAEVAPGLKERDRNEMIKRVLSYGIIDDLIRDENVEDIIINALKPIFVFKSREGMLRTEKKYGTLDDLDLLIHKLLVFSGKHRLKPINNFHLPDGGRVNVVTSPFGPQITFRKFKQRPLSIIDIVEGGMLDYEIAAQLWLYAEGLGIKPANMLVGGMPGAGKTTLLNALFSFFPTNERIVVIEDTLELNTNTRDNCARLEATGELSMRELVKNTLRMRPDRLIVGEVRGEEAADMMTAMNIGKICMGTIHASSSREVVMRLENAPMDVPTEIIPLIDVFIILRQFYQEGRAVRAVVQISETGGIEKKVLLSDLANFDAKTGKLVDAHPSVIYRDRLAQASGVTPKEILEEIKARTHILQQMAVKGKKTIEELAAFSADYYSNPDDAIEKYEIEL